MCPLRSLEAVAVDEIRVPPPVSADPGRRMPLELLPRNAPEVVPVRSERTEMARSGRVAVDVLEVVPALLRRPYRVVDGHEEPDNADQRRDAYEAEHDPARPAPRLARDVQPPVGQCIAQADERADPGEHEGDGARVPDGIVERLAFDSKRLGDRLSRKRGQHGDDDGGGQQPQASRDTAKTTIAETPRAIPPPLLCVANQRQSIAVAPPRASARSTGKSSCRAASAIAGQNAMSAIAA